MKRRPRLPDLAGVALVDILANGVAMLIIVIVLSIAVRMEREERAAEQVEELSTVMSRRFSTSLVLSSLAASPPAQLHDYRNSALDQVYDPELLPIIELHHGFVREFYSGAVWSRQELLREPNAMDAWLAGFSENQKLRLRTDVYDIAQFYLAMSILRDHGVPARHWHFLSGGLGLAAAGHCPPATSAQDCAAGAGGGGAGSGAPEFALGDGAGAGAAGDGAGEGLDAAWPPTGFPGEDGNGLGGGGAAPFPGGAAAGAGPPGEAYFPGADASGAGGVGGGGPGGGAGGGSKSRGLLGSAGGGAGGGGGMVGFGQPGSTTRFRLSSPDSLRADRDSLFSLSGPPPTIEQVLSVLLDFLGALQATLDAGASPSAQLQGFEAHMQSALAAPPELEGEANDAIRDLAMEIEWSSWEVQAHRPLELRPVELDALSDTALIAQPNTRLRSVAIGRAAAAATKALPETGRPALRMNAHPGVWRGLSLRLGWNSILLLPLEQQQPEQFRWRAIAYVAPALDDFIVGFAYAAIGEDGQLLLQAEGNHARLDGHPLRTPYREATFGARGWLVTLYGGLLASLLAGLLLMRRLVGERRA